MYQFINKKILLWIDVFIISITVQCVHCSQWGNATLEGTKIGSWGGKGQNSKILQWFLALQSSTLLNKTVFLSI